MLVNSRSFRWTLPRPRSCKDSLFLENSCINHSIWLNKWISAKEKKILSSKSFIISVKINLYSQKFVETKSELLRRLQSWVHWKIGLLRSMEIFWKYFRKRLENLISVVFSRNTLEILLGNKTSLLWKRFSFPVDLVPVCWWVYLSLLSEKCGDLNVVNL